MLLPAGAAQAGFNPSFLGVSYRFPDLPSQDLNRMDNGRVENVRVTFYWGGLEPAPGVFDWSKRDTIVGKLASRGIRILPVLYGTPSYAGKTSATPPLGSKSARKAWRGFLREAVDHYGPGGDFWADAGPYHSEFGAAAPERPIRTWQIWQEANLSAYFAPRPSARKYRRLVRISHQAITREHAGAKILLAGLPGFGRPRAWTFLKRLYQAKRFKRKFDAAALNPYARGIRQMRLEIRRVRRVMKAHDRRAPLWITEIGWGSGRRGSSPFNKGRRGQKKLLKKSFRLIGHKRRHWHIHRLFWYQWRDPETRNPDCTLCSYTGLFKHNEKPKPAWRAFKHFTGALPRAGPL